MKCTLCEDNIPHTTGTCMNKSRIKLPQVYEDLSFLDRKAVRLAYIEEQKGRCYYCKELLASRPADEVTARTVNVRLFPPNFFDHPVHLHHSHETGLTLGAVHAYCNAVLWIYEKE